MSVKIILLALETLLLFLFLVPLPVICSGNLLGIIVSVMLMLIDTCWDNICEHSFHTYVQSTGKPP